jgi:RNA polymerase sigma-70 factor, ECF subfamily
VSLGDRRLVRRLTAGQESAYRQAVEQHYGRIHGFLYRMTRDVHLAQDLTQETFAAAWRSLDKFEGRSSFATWLHKIALNAYRQHARRTQPEIEPIDEEAQAGCADPSPSLIERLGARQLQERVQREVSALPEIYREAVVLRCYQGLKHREVAELLGVPIGTVSHRLHVAFEKLREALREEVEDCEAVVVRES